jgi:hypothetical protein
VTQQFRNGPFNTAGRLQDRGDLRVDYGKALIYWGGLGEELFQCYAAGLLNR